MLSASPSPILPSNRPPIPVTPPRSPHRTNASDLRNIVGEEFLEKMKLANLERSSSSSSPTTAKPVPLSPDKKMQLYNLKMRYECAISKIEAALKKEPDLQNESALQKKALKEALEKDLDERYKDLDIANPKKQALKE